MRTLIYNYMFNYIYYLHNTVSSYLITFYRFDTVSFLKDV